MNVTLSDDTVKLKFACCTKASAVCSKYLTMLFGRKKCVLVIQLEHSCWHQHQTVVQISTLVGKSNVHFIAFHSHGHATNLLYFGWLMLILT